MNEGPVPFDELSRATVGVDDVPARYDGAAHLCAAVLNEKSVIR